MQRASGVYRDAFGRPVSGASVTVYIAGTQTLASISQASGDPTSPAGLSNPFTTDATGFWEFAAPNGRYDIVVESNSAATQRMPNVALSDAVAGLVNPMTQQGQVIAGGVNGAPTAVAANSTTTPEYLYEINGGVPQFKQVDSSEISNLLPIQYQTGAAVQRIMSKMTTGTEDTFITIIGDSTGIDAPPTVFRWPWRFTADIAPKFPTYTVKYRTWDSVGLAWQAWQTIQTGTGAQTLWISNGSVSGSPSSYCMGGRLNTMFTATTPDLTIINHGHNQGTVGVPTPTFAIDMLDLVETLKSAYPSTSILLMGQNPESSPSTNDPYMAIKNSKYEWVAQSRGLGYINIRQLFLSYGANWASALLNSDGIHPNDTGSQLWADEVSKAFTYNRQTTISEQVQSSLQEAAGEQLLLNGTFLSFGASATVPDYWTAGGTAVVTKDSVHYESAKGYSVNIATTAGAGYMQQNIPLARVAGKWVTLTGRVYVATGQPNTAGRVQIATNLTSAASSFFQNGTDLGHGGFRWWSTTLYIDPAATFCMITMYGDSGTTSGTASFDSVSASVGVLPRRAQVLDIPWNSPGSIGFTTPAPGTFTALTATGTSQTLGSNANASLTIHMNGAAGSTRNLSFETAGVVRWTWQCTSTAETGSDAGSNYNLIASSDSGTTIDVPISITRTSGGGMTLTRPITMSNGQATIGGAAVSSPFLKVNGAAGTARTIQFLSATSLRWVINGADSTTESGSDAGSAWSLNARSDAGASIDFPVSIVRASAGAINLGGTSKRPVVLTGQLGLPTGTAVASASTITPTGVMFHVSGTATIATINLPYTGFTGKLIIIADAAWNTSTSGNIATVVNAVPGQVYEFSYDGTKWYSTSFGSTGAIYNGTPGNPTGTTSLTAVMMGLGGAAAITPVKTGRIAFTISGQMANNTNNDGATVQLRYGTGTAPINGAAVTGTQAGNSQSFTAAAANNSSGFSISPIVTGLTLGTPVWFDLGLQAATGGTASVTGITISAHEI